MTRTRSSVLAGLLLAGLLLAGQPATGTVDKQVNINNANAAELATLKGIGDAKAKAIVDYREKHGPFKSVDDLNEVSGIGDKLMEALRPQVTLGPTAPAAPAAPAQAQAKP